jgi:hypothetical protein
MFRLSAPDRAQLIIVHRPRSCPGGNGTAEPRQQHD